MSFIDTYLEKYRLDEMPEKVKKNLDQLEKDMADKVQSDDVEDFGECLAKYGAEISDLIERVSAKIDDLSIGSLSDVLNLFRFVKTIGFEAYQLVELLSDCVVPDGLSDEEAKEAKEAKKEFGIDLTYFIWVTINPLEGKLTWLPFKKTIEKKVVRWLAGMAIDFAMDFFSANEEVTMSKAVTKTVVRKAGGKKVKKQEVGHEAVAYLKAI